MHNTFPSIYTRSLFYRSSPTFHWFNQGSFSTSRRSTSGTVDRWTELELTNSSCSPWRYNTTLEFLDFSPFLDSIVWGNRCLRAMTGKASASPNNTELSLKIQIGVHFLKILIIYFTLIIITWIIIPYLGVHTIGLGICIFDICLAGCLSYGLNPDLLSWFSRWRSKFP